jgi:hypothetical protein
MKDVYEVLQQKETDAAHVRHEIESLKIVSSLLSDELPMKDARELVEQKEAEIARVRHEIEGLKIVAPLLSEEPASDEQTKKGAVSTVQEERAGGHHLEATGTEGPSASGIAGAGSALWNRLKRKT